jgi:anti-anti-sigma factor
MPSAFSIQTQRDGDTTTLLLTGDLDLASVKTLEPQLDAQWSTPARLLVVDLRLVEFMDSSGLRTLIDAALRAEQQGRRLAIVGGPPKTRRLLAMVDGLTVIDSPRNCTALHH